MVIAIMVMAFALMITAVALTQSQASQRIDAKDIRVQRAEQAADAGLQSAVYALNAGNLAALPVYGVGGLQPLVNAISCLGVSVSAQVPGIVFAGLSPTTSCNGVTPPGASPTPTYRDMGNHSKVSVIVTSTVAGASTGPYGVGFRVVAAGVEDNNTATTADDVVRRRAVTLAPIRPFGAVEGVHNVTLTAAGLLSLLGVQLATRTVNGDIFANNDINITGLALLGLNVLNPDNSVLRTAELQYGHNCCGSVLVPAANLQPQSTTTFLTRKAPYVDPAKPTCPGTCPAQIVNKVLTLSGTASLTLAAGDYHLCGVDVASGATLKTAGATSSAGATRIYVDSPTSAYCSGTGGSGNLKINGSLNPGVSASPTNTQLYVTGNGTAGGTTVVVGNSSLALTSAFFLYAPMSNVTVNYYVFTGSVIGYDTTMNAVNLTGSLASMITQDLGLSVSTLSNQLGVFQDQQYVNCAGTTVDVTAPTKGC
ncbi:hypothetical protein NBH00_14375 [Paraconexibacter antarcticus]|uniref:PilX-like prepilin protein n=1 Tax=Paraconexibacter antarcticus TaxID=2949664 RepID=A0ABY5DMY6_9ACTN|nr:hypothetical protein [Paraconexibacter antarcticus]UTI62548.1 hypothetical protein NBH00_14375 [Paraconexibacter antarcticus]